jgi:four helix bundle protein
VAEGFYRFNPREFHRFLNDAKASLGEARNQLLHVEGAAPHLRDGI